eukprot:CAMPEP_0196580822 /NCGR_PEP_ID=MMETSP1081-20130531/30777_1 /TAXON_ID=36882 /ORGANISM="Pyramimonas amylifera, Strain CCMP720" /LENGTH=603 /DNA_ID=CAMNT_0041900819 /DNA_START=117 /DNA_END=1928 /DNA_ORIENTATION=-
MTILSKSTNIFTPLGQKNADSTWMSSSWSWSKTVSQRQPFMKSIFSRSSCRNKKKCQIFAGQSRGEVTLLDYGVGNVRSVRNAIKHLGFTVREVENPSDITRADRLVFPGVGSFGAAMDILKSKGYAEPLKEYILEDKPFMGICLGMQLLFEGSEESEGVEGLGVIPGGVTAFSPSLGLPVPHMGWSGLRQCQPSALLNHVQDSQRVYFVHSYRALETAANKDWTLSTTDYGGEFMSSVQKGNVTAMQFHPEKSGNVGLALFDSFLSGETLETGQDGTGFPKQTVPLTLAKRVIACLDVRANDQGDLVVTKGDQYDVRETEGERDVRNLGLPVELCKRYFSEGADEVAFLNITGFRDFPLQDMPMLEVLQRSSETVFVPLTVGGGIRDFTDSNGQYYSALNVASEYFRSGADKVSIGSDAVFAAEELLTNEGKPTGKSAIEQISYTYGKQAVVVSIDPRRVWVNAPEDSSNKCIRPASERGPNGEEWCWYQCTVSGGREGRSLGAYEVACAVEKLGAGEILLNCIDRDGTGVGFDLDLVELVSSAVTIPVIASSGAGSPEHFSEVFKETQCAAALAAGIFHRSEVTIESVKQKMDADTIATRL